MPIALLIIPVLSTVLGGLLALRYRRYLPVLISAGAGLLLGASFLDLLPEAIGLGTQAGFSSGDVLGLTLLSFLLFLGIENFLDAMDRRHRRGVQSNKTIGRIAGLMLISHSFRDGMAIGAAFAASHPAGYAVALGIAAHDLGDGMNTIIVVTNGERARLPDYLFLAADALAPLLGGLLTVWLVLSPRSSVILLTLAAGFFVQLATSDFLPEVRRSTGSRKYLMPSILAGCGLIYLANLLLHRL